MQVQSNASNIIIIDEELFHEKMKQLTTAITLKSGQIIQTACLNHLETHSGVSTKIERDIKPIEDKIPELDERIGKLFNKIVGDVFPKIDSTPLFSQFKELFGINDALLNRIVRSASLDPVKNLATDCDNIDTIIVDRMIETEQNQ